MSSGLYIVVDAVLAIGAAARSATDDLQAANVAAAGGGGSRDTTSGITGGKKSGFNWVGSSVTAAGSMDSGKVISALKSYGGR